MVENENNFICVSCGNPIKSLYKQYSQSVLKLCVCGHCGSVADKYLEYDKVIVLIDLILFSKEAYRHVLYNVQYKSHFKLALLQLMIISFNECIYSQNSVNIQESDSFYEATLYLLTLITILGKILFFFTVLLFLNLYNKYNNRTVLSKTNIVKIWKAIVISSFGYFLLLTILIWDDFQREIHLIFINTYVSLSQIQALTVPGGVIVNAQNLSRREGFELLLCSKELVTKVITEKNKYGTSTISDLILVKGSELKVFIAEHFNEYSF